MATFKGLGRRKRREYPVTLNEWRKSARMRCFEMFEDKISAQQVAEAVGAKIETVYKYHRPLAASFASTCQSQALAPYPTAMYLGER